MARVHRQHGAMRPRRRPVRLSLTALLMVLLAAAFGGCSTPGEALPADAPTLEEAVGFTQDRWRSLIESQDRRVERCMAARGFRYDAETIDWRERAEAPHGLFEIISPTAEREYLLRHGYGMTVRIRGLVRTAAQQNNDPQLRYLETLTEQKRAAFLEALTGDDDESAGCLAKVSAVVRRLQLPSDGQLAAAFGQAIGDLHTSDGYRRFARDVITCMRKRGVAVAEDDDLVSVQRPVLVKSLEMTHSEYSYEDGRIHFSMKASRITPEVLAQLPALRAEEFRVAAVEAACRDEHADAMRRLMVTYTGPLVGQFPKDVAALTEALRGST